MEAWAPGCRHHCSFPSPCLASPHLKSVWPSRRRNHGDGQGPLNTTIIPPPLWKPPPTTISNSQRHKSVSPQYHSLQISTEVCQPAYVNLGRKWAAAGNGWGRGSPGSLAHSQLASGQNKGLGHQAFTVGQVPPGGHLMVLVTDNKDGSFHNLCAPLSWPHTYAQFFV